MDSKERESITDAPLISSSLLVGNKSCCSVAILGMPDTMYLIQIFVPVNVFSFSIENLGRVTYSPQWKVKILTIYAYTNQTCIQQVYSWCLFKHNVPLASQPDVKNGTLWFCGTHGLVPCAKFQQHNDVVVNTSELLRTDHGETHCG